MASLTGKSSKDLPSRRLLGRGLSGFGYETTWKGERYARKDFVGVPRDIFVQEAAVLVGLQDHKNVVKTYDWRVDKRSCSLVLEYMDDDLISLLQKKVESSKQDVAGVGLGDQSSTSVSTQSFDLPEVRDIILQLAMGMKHLHNQGIAHGDLKTKNILITHKKDGDQSLKVVKVGDFGLVRTKRKSRSIVSRQVRKLDIVKWKAPESLKILCRQLNESNETSGDGTFRDGTSSESNSNSDSEQTSTSPVVKDGAFAADVYSFAVTCSQILTGKDPYPNLHWKRLGDKILSGLRPKLLDACPLFLSELLISCWGEPAQRPTFDEICERLDYRGALRPTASVAPFYFQSKPKFINPKRKQRVHAIQMPATKRRKIGVAASSSSKPAKSSVLDSRLQDSMTSKYSVTEIERNIELDFQNPQPSVQWTSVDSFSNKPLERARSPDSVLDEGFMAQEEDAASLFDKMLDDQVRRQRELDAEAPLESWAPPDYVSTHLPIRKRVSRALKRCVVVSSDVLKRPSPKVFKHAGLQFDHDYYFHGPASDPPKYIFTDFYDTDERRDNKIVNPDPETTVLKERWKIAFVRIPSKIQHWAVNSVQFCTPKLKSTESEFIFPGDESEFTFSHNYS